MKHLNLSLLGSFSAEFDGERMETFRTSRVQALLIYLVVEQFSSLGGQRREQIIDRLWLDLEEGSLRNNLRTVLHLLRNETFPEILGEDGKPVRLVPFGKMVRLNPNYPLHSDLAEFERLLRGMPADWEVAMQLYRGEMVAGFELEDAGTFADWLRDKRTYYQQKALDTLASLTTLKFEQGLYAESINHARRQIEIDPTREKAHRQLMRALVLHGQRSEALGQYEKCRQILHDELGVDPSQETQTLYAGIYAGDIQSSGTHTEKLRGYDLKEQIGVGHFGVVYRAVQPSVGREVAIKVVLPKFANDPEFIRRFEVEAQTIAHLEHPRIVPLYDYWREPDNAYLVMRWLRGGNLAQSLTLKGGWAATDAIRLVDQVATALHVAHRQQVIHQDLKPANILLDGENNAYLSDFGIALTQGHNGHPRLPIMTSATSISPEQLRDEPITPLTDIYSFGVLLYELVTGQPPFPGVSVAKLMNLHAHEPLPSVREIRGEMPASLDTVIQRATAKDPSQRYPSAPALAHAFRQAFQPTTDPLIAPPLPKDLPDDVVNPYKGLQAFQEKDAGIFHGRTNLITHLTNQLSTHPITQPTNYATKNFLALVGPSGSGKSSVVGAGLVPALRHGALPNSENWFITNMMPSTHPYDELETALLRVAVNPPPTLLDQLRTDERGLLRAVRRILPDRDSQLLLVIDQFEELFTLTATPADTNAFLDTLVATVTDPRSPVSVVLTLRADFFDRPLHHPAFGELMRRNTEVITPMSAEELIQAIRFPAEQVGAQIEPALLTQIITDVNDQPGALPLLQYALTELFERRQGNLLTKGAYQEIGGVLGALGRRAEEIYNNLDKPEQATAKQLFLRLVTLGEGVEDTRRRVLQSELESLINQQPATSNQQPTAKSKILNAFGSARLLSFDRDPDTRHATVEVAHEALLREWSRLRGWLADSREDIRLQRQLAMAGKEWRNSEQDDSFLLRGARLDRFEGWARQTSIALNQQEKAFLEASLAERIARHTAEENRRQQELATAQRLAETEKARAIEAENRATEQAGYAHTLRRRAYGLAGVLGVAMLLAIAALFFGNRANQNATLAQQAQATSVAEADFRATAEGDALLNADLAATRAVEAENSASLAETREAEAVLAQAQAQDEANVRATAEAIAILERENAEEQTRLTRSREMSLAALNNIKTHAELSVLLALQALNVAHTKEAEDTLHQAVINSQIRLRLEGHGNPMAEIMFSPDGSQIAGISWRFTEERSYGTMYVWDAVTGEEVWSLDSLGYAANQIDYSPDSQILVVTTEETSSGGLVKFFNAKTGEFIRSLDIMPAGIHSETAGTALWVAPQGLSVEFSPDGQRLVVSHFDLEKLSATVFDLETGESLFSLPGHGNSEGGDPFWQEGPTYSPDGKYIAGAGTNGTIYLWDSNSGEVVLLIETANRDWTDFAVSTDGLELFTIGQRSNVTYLSLWDIATGELILEKGLGDGSANIAISPDESLLAVGIRNENVYLLDAQNLEKKQELVGDNTLDWNDFDFSPDGTQLVGKAENGVVLVWDILPKEILTLYHGGNVSAVAYSPTGVLIATADSIGVLKIWDSTTGQKLQEIEAHFDWLGDIDFAPDGSRLATAGDDYMAKIWDVATGELLLTLEGHTDWVNRLSFSPDGKQLTTAGADGTIRIWDSETGKLLYLIDDVNAGWSVAYSADGRRIVTGFASQFDNLGNAVKIWDSESGELLVELEGSVRGTTTGVQFTSDGEQVVAGGVFGNVFVWNSHTGEKLRSIEIGKQIIEVKLHENDKHIIIGTVEGTVEIWDMETGERLVTLFNQGSSGHQFLELSPNGKHVLSGGVLDGMVRVLTTDLAELEGIARSRLTRGFTEAECRQFNITPCPTNQ